MKMTLSVMLQFVLVIGLIGQNEATRNLRSMPSDPTGSTKMALYALGRRGTPIATLHSRRALLGVEDHQDLSVSSLGFVPVKLGTHDRPSTNSESSVGDFERSNPFSTVLDYPQPGESKPCDHISPAGCGHPPRKMEEVAAVSEFLHSPGNEFDKNSWNALAVTRSDHANPQVHGSCNSDSDTLCGDPLAAIYSSPELLPPSYTNEKKFDIHLPGNHIPEEGNHLP